MASLFEILEERSDNFWAVLTEEQKKRLVSNSQIKEFDKRVSLYTFEKVGQMQFLLKGKVKLCTYVGVDMKEVILEVFSKGSFVSLQPIAPNPDKTEYAETLSISKVLVIHSWFIQDLMKQNSTFAKLFFEQLTHRLNRVSSRLASVHSSVLLREQVVKLIFDLIEVFGRNVGFEVVIEHDMTHYELASLIQRSRQSITTVMAELKKENIIYYDRTSILVKDVEKLRNWGHN